LHRRAASPRSVLNKYEQHTPKPNVQKGSGISWRRAEPRGVGKGGQNGDRVVCLACMTWVSTGAPARQGVRALVKRRGRNEMNLSTRLQQKAGIIQGAAARVHRVYKQGCRGVPNRWGNATAALSVAKQQLRMVHQQLPASAAGSKGGTQGVGGPAGRVLGRLARPEVGSAAHSAQQHITSHHSIRKNRGRRK